HSPSVLRFPEESRNVRSGTRRGASASETAATSPRASGAIRRTVSSAGRQAASTSLRPKPPIPYTAASPAAPAATAASAQSAGRARGVLHRVDRSSAQPINGPAMSNKMWGGRFGAEPDAVMEEINASIGVDRALYAQDIAASKAHAEMLARQGILSQKDADKI